MRVNNLEPAEHEASQLYRNDGGWRFVRMEAQPFSERAYSSTSAAVGDIDGDGDPDVVLGDWGEAESGDYGTVLINRTSGCGQSVHIRLKARTGALDPIGARVVLITRGRDGERRQLREATSQSTFRSQSADPFLFGVPPGHRIVRAEVRWPDGEQRIVTRFERGAGRVTVVAKR